jgi:hypothetical protein
MDPSFRPRPSHPRGETGRSNLKELVEFIARSLVDDPMQVRVRERRSGREIRLQLTVAEEDAGKVIGRAGRIASAIRALLRAAAERRGVRANLDIE